MSSACGLHLSRYNVRPMRLLLKFSLILILAFSAGAVAAGYFARSFLQQTAHDEVLQQARLMMGSAGAVRTYTSKQVGPLLQEHQARINSFLAQTVPAYAATEAFNYLRTDYPDYTYKEATLNPTNLRDRPVDWEADIINRFRNDSGDEITGERNAASVASLSLAHPTRITQVSCLGCHQTPDQAPAAMLKLYGRDNGFGWKLNET